MLPLAQAQPPAAPPPQPLPHPELPDPSLVFPGMPWWVYAAAGTVIVALLGLVLWLLLRPRKAAPPEPKKPWQAAMRRLRDLASAASTQPPGDIAAGVSETLRGYFLDRYHIPAPFRTTQEIFQRDGIPATSQRLHRYAPLADLWDQLAFAPVPANRTESAALLEKAISFLEEDRP